MYLWGLQTGEEVKYSIFKYEVKFSTWDGVEAEQKENNTEEILMFVLMLFVMAVFMVGKYLR